jgi:hypothetical protein
MTGSSDAPSVSGTLVSALLVVARESLGDDVVNAALDRTSSEDSERVRNALPGEWIPIRVVETAFGAIAEVAGRDLPGLHVELARVSVDRAVKSLWRLLLRFTSDEALVMRTPVIFGKAYNRGKLVPSIPSPGRGEVELREWPDVPEWAIRGTRVGIETVLRAAGRKDVRVEGHRTNGGAVYVATWK